MTTRHQVIPSVNVFVIKNSKVLLGRRLNTGWSDGLLCPFGGHIEKNESPIAAIVREVEEELGVAVKPEDVDFTCIAARNTGGPEYAAYEFVIRDKEYEFYNAEPHKCSELVWANLDNLPEDLIDDFRIIIQQSVINNERFIEIGYEK